MAGLTRTIVTQISSSNENLTLMGSNRAVGGYPIQVSGSLLLQSLGANALPASSDVSYGGLLYAKRSDGKLYYWNPIFNASTQAVSLGSSVSVSGTPASNQVSTWTDADTITGTTKLTFDETNLVVGTGTVSSGIQFYSSTENIGTGGTANFLTINSTAASNAGRLIVSGSGNIQMQVDGANDDTDAFLIRSIGTGGGIKLEGADANSNIMLTNTAEDNYIKITNATAGAAETIKIVAAGTGTAALDIDCSGGIDIEAGTQGFALDSTGVVSIDGADDMNFTITSGVSGEDLTIQQIGGNDSSIIITAAGTGTDAVSIDATAGSMLIAPNLIDSKTLTIGPSSATQLTLSPHGTAASELISLVNTAGTAQSDTAAAVQVTATAGAITLNAGGTGASAIRIKAANAAGGIDLDSGTKGYSNISTGIMALSSSNASAGSVQILASNAAGGVRIAAGTSHIFLDASGTGAGVKISSQNGTTYLGANLQAQGRGDTIFGPSGTSTSGIIVSTGWGQTSDYYPYRGYMVKRLTGQDLNAATGTGLWGGGSNSVEASGPDKYGGAKWTVMISDNNATSKRICAEILATWDASGQNIQVTETRAASDATASGYVSFHVSNQGSGTGYIRLAVSGSTSLGSDWDSCTVITSKEVWSDV